MFDRTSKALLSIIAVLLSILVLRPMLTATPAQASPLPSPFRSQSELAVSNGTVYVLQDGKLYVYLWKNKNSGLMGGLANSIDPGQLRLRSAQVVGR